MRRGFVGLFMLALGVAGAGVTFAQEVDVTAGQRLFRQRCGACHQIGAARNGVGPHLQAIHGRAAGSIEGFNYSPALRASGITWNDEKLDAYLANPTAMIRGTCMTQRFTNAAERRAIIEFLATH